MPKQKTHSGSKKRFRLTGSGKIKRNKAGKRHILTKKSSDRKRRLRSAGLADSTDVRRIKRMLGIA